MKIEEVVLKAIQDHSFAEKLHAEAKAAANAGVGSAEWKKYIEQFASSPEELMKLQSDSGVKPLGITTLTTTTTYTTAACTTTGTTTTTTTN